MGGVPITSNDVVEFLQDVRAHAVCNGTEHHDGVSNVLMYMEHHQKAMQKYLEDTILKDMGLQPIPERIEVRAVGHLVAEGLFECIGKPRLGFSR